jgi:hypothetical protein
MACSLLLLASCQRGWVPLESPALGDQANPGLRTQQEVQEALSRQQDARAGEGVRDNSPATARHTGSESAESAGGVGAEQAQRLGPNPAARAERPDRMRLDSRSARRNNRQQPAWARAGHARTDAAAEAQIQPSSGDMSRLRAFRPELFLPSTLQPALSAAAPPPPGGHFDLEDPLYLALFIILVLLALVLLVLILAKVISALGLIGVLLLAALILALVLLL